MTASSASDSLKTSFFERMGYEHPIALLSTNVNVSMSYCINTLWMQGPTHEDSFRIWDYDLTITAEERLPLKL